MTAQRWLKLANAPPSLRDWRDAFELDAMELARGIAASHGQHVHVQEFYSQIQRRPSTQAFSSTL